MDSSSTPTTDSVPSTDVKNMRALRAAFDAANECLKRTGNTEHELAMMDGIVSVQLLFRSNIVGFFQKEPLAKPFVFSQIKAVLVRPTTTQAQIDELRALAVSIGIEDLFDEIVAFDMASAPSPFEAPSPFSQGLAQGIAQGAEMHRQYDNAKDEQAAEEEAYNARAHDRMKRALAEQGLTITAEQAQDLMKSYVQLLDAEEPEPDEDPAHAHVATCDDCAAEIRRRRGLIIQQVMAEFGYTVNTSQAEAFYERVQEVSIAQARRAVDHDHVS
jgi:hypothetical protein